MPPILLGWRHFFFKSAYRTTWNTNHASFDWFKTEDGSTLKPEMLDRVVGIRVAPNMAINVTAEVAQIYFDNFVLS